MVLVDSSVWIDYLSQKTSKMADQLEPLLRPVNQVVMAGIILQEILQGIRNHQSHQLTQKLLSRLPILIPNIETHLSAAEIFRSFALKGIPIATVDALIAALAIQNQARLFTLDKDFRAIARHSRLRLFE